MKYNVGDFVFHVYGIDKDSNNVMFSSKDKFEVISFVKRCSYNTDIYCLKVEKVIPIEDFVQLSIFDLKGDLL